MSQTTANDMISAIGMTEVNVDHPPARAETPRKRNILVVVASIALLGAGFKMMGDYVCNEVIDSWADRQRSTLSTPTPEAQALVAQWAAEQEQEALAESAAVTPATP